MLIIFINIKGLEGKEKKMALHRFINLHNPDIVLVRETMGISHDLCNFMEISLKG